MTGAVVRVAQGKGSVTPQETQRVREEVRRSQCFERTEKQPHRSTEGSEYTTKILNTEMYACGSWPEHITQRHVCGPPPLLALRMFISTAASTCRSRKGILVTCTRVPPCIWVHDRFSTYTLVHVGDLHNVSARRGIEKPKKHFGEALRWKYTALENETMRELYHSEQLYSRNISCLEVRGGSTPCSVVSTRDEG